MGGWHWPTIVKIDVQSKTVDDICKQTGLDICSTIQNDLNDYYWGQTNASVAWNLADWLYRTLLSDYYCVICVFSGGHKELGEVEDFTFEELYTVARKAVENNLTINCDSDEDECDEDRDFSEIQKLLRDDENSQHAKSVLQAIILLYENRDVIDQEATCNILYIYHDDEGGFNFSQAFHLVLNNGIGTSDELIIDNWSDGPGKLCYEFDEWSEKNGWDENVFIDSDYDTIVEVLKVTQQTAHRKIENGKYVD